VSRSLLYVAYPMRLDLGAANAIQTYTTVRELRELLPDMRLVVPRWLREPSAFEELDALHLPRPAVNKLSKVVPWAGWSYIERTLYSLMLVMLLVFWRLSRRGYRVLYVRDTVCAAWLALLSSLHGACVIYEVHDLETWHPSGASRWPRRFWSGYLRWLDRTALKRATLLVSLTGTFKNWAVARNSNIGRVTDRGTTDIAVIPDAFDPDLYYPLDKVEVRNQLGLPTDAFIVGYAGLTFAYRRLDLLVEAFAGISRSDKSALLLLVGGRPGEVQDLRRQALQSGIPGDKLITPGQVSQKDVALYINAADVLVIPDTVTGLTASPLKLFEYMAVGKPLVCKDMPALREIIDEEAALFFQDGDVEGLGNALERLRSDPALRLRMGRAALQEAQQYTYRARAEKIAEVVASCR
jgi:glycosyltransferase involved in cell wall biosynthesis